MAGYREVYIYNGKIMTKELGMCSMCHHPLSRVARAKTCLNTKCEAWGRVLEIGTVVDDHEIHRWHDDGGPCAGEV